MTQSKKMNAGSTMPALRWAKVGGGEIGVNDTSGWRLLIVYRGRHCPLCKKYFKTLDGLLDDFKTEGVEVLTVSADPKEKAEADVAEFGWRFPVGYGLALPQMAELGLYISDPRTPPETDRPFAEPGLFLINPEGKAQVIDISNAPFARPDLANILAAAKFIKERQSPIRGMRPAA